MSLPIFSEERRKWWTLGAVSFGLFMIMLDNTVVNVALPSVQEDLGAGLSRAAVDRHRLRAQLRRPDAGRRQARRRLRPPADLHHRDRGLYRRLALVWTRRLGEHADRGTRRAGRRRGADEPRDALDHRRDLRAEGARDGDRDLGRHRRARARDRAARRRTADRAPELALDLLRQHPRRRRRDRRQPPVDHRSRKTRRTRASTYPGSRPRRSACSRSRTA